ncbi:hypothetical protein LPJ74_002998, partial [Coemansia sp. RSA 1843]
VALGDKGATMHTPAYNKLSPLTKSSAQTAKPQHASNGSQRQHLPLHTSYYNARLNPIHGGPTQRTTYHGAYEGIPLTEDPGVRVLKQILYAKKGASVAASDSVAMTVPMTPVSSTISVEQAQACASWSAPSPDSPSFSQARPATSAERTTETQAPHFSQRHQRQNQNQQPLRPATSREKRTSLAHFSPQQRPQTAAQKSVPESRSQKRLTGWRDIHVKSLSRVDSILREAVGLGEGRRRKGGDGGRAPSSRWTTYMPAEPQHGGARYNSGLGITVGQSTDPATQNKRPGTAHALLWSQSAAPEPGYINQMHSFAAVPAMRRNKSVAVTQARPSTSSARLGTGDGMSAAYDPHQQQQQPLTPVSTPTRRRQDRRKSDNRKLSIHIQDGENADEGSIMMGTSLPARLRTAAPMLELARSNSVVAIPTTSGNGSDGGARVMSMYMPRDEHFEVSDGLYRQVSMYGAPVRPIQLSRDELRRSRLFAEYELLVASKNAEAEAEAEDANKNQHDDSVGVEDITEAGLVSAGSSPTALNNISEEIEDEDEDEDEDVDEYEDDGEDEETTTRCYDSHPPETIAVANGQQASDQPEDKPGSALPPHMQALASGPRAGAMNRRVRGAHAASMYTSADLFSKKQTEKRWSRIICQNQHLFTPQTVAAQIGTGANENGEEPLLFDIEEVSCSDEEEDEEPSRRPLVTQSLMLDLPPSADLFADVTQALAERLPPQPPSAGSTASASSASTFAHRNDLLLSPEQPLSALPLSMPPPPPRKKSTAEKPQPSSPADDGKDKQNGTSSRRSSLSSGSILSKGSSEAEAEAEVAGYLTTSSRSSIYIDADDILSSAIFAAGELPYQKEQMNSGAQLQTPQPRADETLPTIAAGDARKGSAAAEEAEDGGSRRMAAPDTDMHDTNTTDLEDNSDRDSATYRHEETAAEDSAEGSGARHSEYLRQQLDAVEGRTPATELGSELSKGDRENQELLEAYMKRFDFHEQPVDFALRQLFQQLHLPSESQQIDRVIASFARRYNVCNAGLFRSADIVYAYAYAILLLHTDAHNPRIRHKISKPQFVARAKLLDEHAASCESEMFDEILDILYENVTMVKFEYAPTDAPSAVGMLLPAPASTLGSADSHALQSGASQLFSSPILTESAKDYHQSPGISGWLRRVFASSSAVHAPAKPPLTPLDIPSKEQYSYTAGARRRVSSIASMASSPTTPAVAAAAAASSPHLPEEALEVLRPNTTHGTFPRTAAQNRMRANSADPFVSLQQQPSPTLLATATSPKDDLPRIDTSNLPNAAHDTVRSASAARPFRSSPLAGGDSTSPVADSATSVSPDTPLQAGSPTSLRTNAMMANMESSFSPTDIVAPAQQAMVETIRLSSLKGHIKRRVSLRKGRPLSGVIYQQASGHDQQAKQQKQSFESGVVVGATIKNAIKGAANGIHHASSSPVDLDPSTNALLNGNALLRVDMAGRVSRKMERLDNGRRGFMRRWKDVWMVLSGSRLYLFRPNDSAHSETRASASASASPDAVQKAAVAIQSIIPLRNGVAVVDTAYKKYPHVFRILAGDGSEVLVKTPSDDAVAEWMARINCAAAFKTMEVDRRTLASILPDPADASDSTIDPETHAPAPSAPAASEQRTRLLETKAANLDARLNDIDDNLERNLRLFKQLVSMVPLTRQGRTKTVHYANAVRSRLKDLYLDEQRLTCYKDVLELDLAIEYELAGHLAFELDE